MPEKPLLPSALSNPQGPTPHKIEGISGRAKTTNPLTKRSYDEIRRKRDKLQQRTEVSERPKLSHFLDDARIPRSIALKITELTVAYNHDLERLIDAARRHSSSVDTAPELEGRFEKSRTTAERFQKAMAGVERNYGILRTSSADAIKVAMQNIDALKVEDDTKIAIRNLILNKYDIDSNTFESRDTLLPLIKGSDIDGARRQALDHLLSFPTQENKSSDRASAIVTKNGAKIEMLYQVQPSDRNMNLFSDHTGFVAGFSKVGTPPLCVYYHSLEHGHQHTHNRALRQNGSTRPSYLGSEAVVNPRTGFIDKLKAEGLELLGRAKAGKGHALLIVGECTSYIDSRIRHTVRDLPGAQPFTIQFINASKPTYGSGGGVLGQGKGVHALTGYLFVNKVVPPAAMKVEAKLIEQFDGDGSVTRQNVIAVTYAGEKHAFTHLLNGKENELAEELAVQKYVSVGGDLNNISVGTEIVETSNRDLTYMATGSNSTGTKMYDKIVLLPEASPQASQPPLKKAKTSQSSTAPGKKRKR
ncbi:MAG: hypothetical protein ACRBN8_40760 [Nannocystales bacterium]